MKKRLISLLIVLTVVFSVTGGALAVEPGHTITPFASAYLDGYSVALSAKGNGKMSLSVDVNGMGMQDKIGVVYIDIEQKVNGTWKYYNRLDAVDHPEFYSYHSRDHVCNATFNGTPGISYRVTVKVYAQKGAGSDTGYVTSYAIVCK